MTGSNAKAKRPRLEVFENFAPSSEALRPGYAYLIRSSVRMPELYPLLGELIFESRINLTNAPPNVIGMFIEDSPDNLIQHLNGPDEYVDTSDITFAFGNVLVNEPEIPRMAAWLHTFGDFHNARGELKEMQFDTTKVAEKFKDGEKLKEEYRWWYKAVAGPGNPMAIMRFFKLVQSKSGSAELNVFLLNSLSSLYRNLGLSESAAFLKSMLNNSIWSVEPATGKAKMLIRHRPGLFFAVLQEDVLKPNEASYLESFFDGVIRVDPYVLDSKFRVAHVDVEVLPELITTPVDRKFVYVPVWQSSNNTEVSKAIDKWGKGKYIRTEKASKCSDLKPINPKKENEKQSA